MPLDPQFRTVIDHLTSAGSPGPRRADRGRVVTLDGLLSDRQSDGTAA